MVEEDVIRITSRYLRRDPEKIEEIYEALGIETLSDLAAADPATISDALGVKESTAKKIIVDAREKMMKGVEEEENYNKNKIDHPTPTFLIMISIINGCRGRIPVILRAISASGKTTTSTMIADVVVAPSYGGTLSAAATRDAIEKSKSGIVFDDIQANKRVPGITVIIKSIREGHIPEGPNKQHWSGINRASREVIGRNLAIIATWDITHSELPLKDRDLRRWLIIPLQSVRVSTPGVINDWLEISVDRRLSLNVPVYSGIVKYVTDADDTYKELVSDLNVTEVPDTLREAPGRVLQYVDATIGSVETVIHEPTQPTDPSVTFEVFEFWKETTRRFYIDNRVQRTFTRTLSDLGNSRTLRQRASAIWAVVQSIGTALSSMEWEEGTFKQAVETTEISMNAVVNRWPRWALNKFRETAEKVAKEYGVEL